MRERPDVDGMMGDVVNSAPVFVGKPRGINRDQAPYPITDLYSDFASTWQGRQGIVYIGANDGMVHGFDGLLGDEVMGYVPNLLIDSTKAYHNDVLDLTSPFYQHRYYVDLTPRFNDVYMPETSVSPSKSWNTVMLGGLGAGGKGYFLLNVTDPSDSRPKQLLRPPRCGSSRMTTTPIPSTAWVRLWVAARWSIRTLASRSRTSAMR